MEWIVKLFEAVKLPIRFFAWVCLISGSLLFLGKGVLSPLGLQEFIDSYRLYIGLAFVAAVALLLIDFVGYVYKKIHSKYIKYKTSKLVAKKMDSLDPNEQAVLCEFFVQDSHTIQLPVDNAIVAGLIQSGIISVVGNIGEPSLVGTLFPVKVSEFARQYLSRDTIGLPKGKLTSGEIIFIKKNRPGFMEHIHYLKSLKEGHAF